jgi:hypothetical protein
MDNDLNDSMLPVTVGIPGPKHMTSTRGFLGIPGMRSGKRRPQDIHRKAVAIF